MTGSEYDADRHIRWAVYPGEPGQFLARFDVSRVGHGGGDNWQPCGSPFRTAEDAKGWVEEAVARELGLPMGARFLLTIAQPRERLVPIVTYTSG